MQTNSPFFRLFLILTLFLYPSLSHHGFGQEPTNPRFIFSSRLSTSFSANYEDNNGRQQLRNAAGLSISPLFGVRIKPKWYVFAHIQIYTNRNSLNLVDSLAGNFASFASSRSSEYGIGVRRFFKTDKKFTFFLDGLLHYGVNKKIEDEDTLDEEERLIDVSYEEYVVSITPGLTWFPFRHIGFTANLGEVFFKRSRHLRPGNPPNYYFGGELSLSSFRFGIITRFGFKSAK